MTKRSYTYDENNNKLTESLLVEGKTFNMSYSYNSLDQLSRVFYPNTNMIHSGYSSANSVSYDPDGFGRATKVSDIAGDKIRSATYHVNGLYEDLVYQNDVTAHLEITSTMSPKSLLIQSQSPALTPSVANNEHLVAFDVSND